MKKYFSLALAAAMVLAMTGCSAAEPSEPDTGAPASSAGGASEPTKPAETKAPALTTAAKTDEPGAAVTTTSPTPEKPVDTTPVVIDTTHEPTTPTTSATSSTSAAPTTTAPTTVVATTAPVTTAYGPTDIGGRPTGEKAEEKHGIFDAISDGISGWFGESPEYALAEDCATVDGMIKDAAPPAVGAVGGEACCPIDPPYDPIIEPIEPIYQPQAGLLTGGEWCDNKHWSDWTALYASREDWPQFKSDWRISFDERIAVKVMSGGEPIEGVKVSCGSAVNSAVTDNNGMAYLFCTAINGVTEPIVAEYSDGTSAQADGIIGSGDVSIDLGDITVKGGEKRLDLMIVCDTTGSMSDELEYLKEELKDVIRRVKSDNENIPTRLSVNFYRDEGDEYVVRAFPFTDDIDVACGSVGEQYAAGGGDFPEAVHTALDNAINDHDWDEDSVKIMFLVLDAPPHEDAQIVDTVNSLIIKAAEMGIRIIPIASSGIDKSTEYLLRTFAFTTGGTYTFLTNDSGVGGDHIEATVGAYNVEKLNDMMVRIVNGYLD